jgi:hypothetical protein
MKKFSVLSIVSIFLILLITGLSSERAVSYSSGSPEGMTGSPGDVLHCGTSCHSNNPGTPTGSEFISLMTNIPSIGYEAGVTYNLTATMTDSAVTKFGFQISPQNLAGDLIGTLIAGPETGLVGLNKYVTHDFTSTSGNGSRSWVFQWTAPESGSGDVTFYGAYNFSDANGQTSGDVILLADTTVIEGVTIRVDEKISHQISTYPNPAKDFIYVKGISDISTFRLIDLHGNVIQFGNIEANEPIMINQSVRRAGVYILAIQCDDAQNLVRVVIK